MKYLRRKKESEIQNEVAELYIRYRKQITVFVNIHTKGSLIQSTGLVEDIVQDVFLEAVRKYDSFRGHSNPVGWLCQTANYKIMEYDRLLQKVHMVCLDELEHVEDEYENGFMEVKLKLLLDASMSAEEKLRFYRFFLWGWTIEEIAEAEGISENNVRVKLTRLKKRLLQEIHLHTLVAMVLIEILKSRIV